MSEDEKIKLEKDQRYWLQNRELRGSSKVIFNCLKGAYDNRLSTLKYKKPTKAKVRRLAPAAFATLPAAIRHTLESRNCTVPQANDNASPHNVICGEFLRKGQKDWAVLCSHDGTTSILIFWNGSTSKITKLSPSRDDDWFQSFGTEYGFSREIMVAGKKQIEAYHDFAKQFADEPDLPPITHDGIDQFFVNKASSVLYYYQGQWLTLSGAD